MIDHAVHHPTQTEDDVRAACDMCAELVTASICVKPSHVALAAELLLDTNVAAEYQAMRGASEMSELSDSKISEPLTSS